MPLIAAVAVGVAVLAAVFASNGGDDPTAATSVPVERSPAGQVMPTHTLSSQPPPPTTGPCVVTELLVPTCGAWLGASTPSRDGTYDYEVGLREYEAVAGGAPDILHFYTRDATPFPSPAELALAEPGGRRRSILAYNWKPSTKHTWRQVADGAADGNIRTVAKGLRAYPRRLFLAISHEPENDIGAAGSGMTPADYVDMYRHVVSMLRSLDVRNAVYVMNYMGFDRWSDVVDELYPGDDVIDWIAYDPYGFAGAQSIADVVDLANPAKGWPGFYSWAVERFPGKPLMLSEWGIDLRGRASAATILAHADVILARDYPAIKALVYWNDHNPGGFVVRLDEPTAVGAELAAGYRELAASPYFDALQPAQAP